jgi:hypothetical protein
VGTALERVLAVSVAVGETRRSSHDKMYPDTSTDGIIFADLLA